MQRQVQLLLKLSHPSVIRFFGLSAPALSLETPKPLLRLVTEYASGGDLQMAITAARPPSERTLLRWAREICAGMAYLHDKLMAHLGASPTFKLATSHLRGAAFLMLTSCV